MVGPVMPVMTVHLVSRGAAWVHFTPHGRWFTRANPAALGKSLGRQCHCEQCA
jgi:hypothetical protein